MLLSKSLLRVHRVRKNSRERDDGGRTLGLAAPACGWEGTRRGAGRGLHPRHRQKLWPQGRTCKAGAAGPPGRSTREPRCDGERPAGPRRAAGGPGGTRVALSPQPRALRAFPAATDHSRTEPRESQERGGGSPCVPCAGDQRLPDKRTRVRRLSDAGTRGWPEDPHLWRGAQEARPPSKADPRPGRFGAGTPGVGGHPAPIAGAGPHLARAWPGWDGEAGAAPRETVTPGGQAGARGSSKAPSLFCGQRAAGSWAGVRAGAQRSRGVGGSKRAGSGREQGGKGRMGTRGGGDSDAGKDPAAVPSLPAAGVTAAPLPPPWP